MEKNRTRRKALMVMLTEQEKKAVKNAAKKRGMTMSTYCRMVLIGDAASGDGYGKDRQV